MDARLFSSRRVSLGDGHTQLHQVLPRHRSPLLFVVMMKHVTSVHFPLSLIVIHLSLVSVQVSACNHIVGRLCVKCFSVDVCIYSIILCFSDCHDCTCASFC